MGHPNMRNLKAREVPRPGQKTALLVVTGEAETNGAPDLAEYVEPAGDPTTLVLNGTAGGGQEWQPILFEKEVTPGQYSRVDIRWNEQPLSGGMGVLPIS